MLSAYMKVGKSTLMYAFVAAVARGEPFCGHPTSRTPVLVLAVEEHKREVVNRLIKFGVKPGDPVMVHVGPLHPNSETYHDLDKTVRENNIGLVVVDTLSRFWNLEDENDNAEALRALAPLSNIVRSTGCTVLLVHHNGKGEGVGGKEIRGASALFGAVDQALLLKHHGEQRATFRRIETFGRFDATPPEIIIQLDEDTGSYKLIGTQKDARIETIRHQIRSWLEGNPGPHTVGSLVAAIKVPKSSIHRALATPQPWFFRQGDGTKGSPYSYETVGEGGVLVDPPNLVRFPGKKLLEMPDADLLEYLDLAHLED